MTRIDFKDNDGNLKISGDIPSSWEEMTSAQVQFVFREYDKCLSGEMSPLMLSLKIMYNFLGIRGLPTEKAAKSSEICQNLYMLCERTLGFLFVADAGGALPRLSFNSVMNPLPAVRGGNARMTLLTGPASLLQNLTFGEFRRASAALNAFFRTSDIADLDECIAHLYRRRAARPNRAGRHVRPFRQEDFTEEVRAISPIPGWQKNIIMMWFSSCVGYLQTGKVTLNGEDVDLGKLFSSGDGKGPAFTWNDILVQVAREGTIGNIDRVDEEPLFSILAIMWTNYKESKKYEKAGNASQGKQVPA